jgi:hypothetical protein
MASNQLAVVQDAAPTAVPMSSLLLLLNTFIGNTTTFLNEFARTAESKLIKSSTEVSRLEKNLILLEAKLARIPGLTDLPQAEVSGKKSGIAPQAVCASSFLRCSTRTDQHFGNRNP